MIYLKQTTGSLAAMLGTLALFGSCGSENVMGATMSEVAGLYTATTFEREVGEGTVDQLALGASITLNLSSDGTTAGLLFVPAASDSLEDFVADLAGTWSLDGPLVRLVHPTNTFLEDMGLLYAAGRLGGERETAFDIIRVVLTR